MASISCAIGSEVDVYVAIGRARELASALGFDEVDRTRIEIVILELARNILVHARGGKLSIEPIDAAGRRGVVVVAEDDDAIAHMVGAALGDAGFLCLRARDGEEALAVSRREVPDCLVLDLQMPGMNGLEVQRELTNAGLRLPVVVITGHDEPGAGARCLSAGAAAYLRKPFDDRTILDAIAAAVAGPTPS